MITMQTIAFIGMWSAMVIIARSQGRYPPELFFGITIYYGLIWIIGLFIVCGIVANLTCKPFATWAVIFTGLLSWLIYLWPSFDSRPFAMPSFFALGVVILTCGTGLGLQYLRRHTEQKIQGEQAAPSNH